MQPDRQTLYKEELTKLQQLFSDVEPTKTQLIEGLLDNAAFLLAETSTLKNVLMETGTVKCHPEYPELQKPTEAGKQYLKNLNTYAILIKTLNSILGKDMVEPEDGFDEFMRGYYGKG